MKRGFFFLLIFTAHYALNACDVCEKNQPKITKGLTHGPGPSGNMEMVIASLAFILVLISLFFSMRFLVRPGEKNPNHIKNFINQEFQWKNNEQ